MSRVLRSSVVPGAPAPGPAPITRDAVQGALRALGYPRATVLALDPLAGPSADADKKLGYGEPIRVRFSHDSREHAVVLRTMASNYFGHDRRSDRAGELLHCFDIFGGIPRHVRALDVGALMADGSMCSLREAGELYLVTEWADGRLYAEDLRAVGKRGEAEPRDVERAGALARYLVELHAEKHDDAGVYVRAIRDLVGHGEGIFGIVDGYPRHCAAAPPPRLQAIEHRCLDWRWRLRGMTHRLCTTHGDFHPFNVLFREGSDFTLLDRSRGGRGDPADDVACMTINYLFFGLQFRRAWTSGHGRLWSRFWGEYLDHSGDEEILRVIAPFYAWRALVVANPVWYPNIDEGVRERLLAFAEDTLDSSAFRPDDVHRLVR